MKQVGSTSAWLVTLVCLPFWVDAAAPDNAVPPADDQAEEAATADANQNAAEADAKDAANQVAPNPYAAIIVRNPFGLKPVPIPVPPEVPQPQVTPSALKLTGITTLLSGKRAMFVLQEPNKPILTSDLVREGERDSVITNLEVLQIDEQISIVRVNYGGKELALNFVDNGLKPPVGPPPTVPGVPGAPGRPMPVPFSPPMNTGIQPPISSFGGGDNASGLRNIPTRPTRLQAGGQSPGGFGGVNNVGTPPQNQQFLTPEQQLLNLRIQEKMAEQNGIPFPPTPPGADQFQPNVDPGMGNPRSVPLPPIPGSR